jgi:steroid 5-alpha reductase family enzyme
MLPAWEQILFNLYDQVVPFLRCSYNESFSQCQLDPAIDPIVPSFAIMLGFVVYSYLWSVICQNVSKVDQIWSITPVVYCAHYLYIFYARETRRHASMHGDGFQTKHENYVHQRLALMTALVVLWCVMYYQLSNLDSQ